MKVDYWLKDQSEQNFGDSLTDLFLDEMFMGAAIQVPACRIIGSTIADFIVEQDLGPPSPENNGPLVFWGAGLRDVNSLSHRAQARCVFASVRGPLTRARLGLGPSIPIGDPAHMLPAFYQPLPSLNFQSKLICMPHFHDRRSDEVLLSISKADAVLRPNISPGVSNIKNVIDAICASDFVLSASLHGAIVAASYGKPFCFWNPGHVDLPFKWHDFAASVDIGAVFAQTVEEGQSFYESHIRPRLCLPKLLPILKAAPFFVKPSAFLKVAVADDMNIIDHHQLMKLVDALERDTPPLSLFAHPEAFQMRFATLRAAPTWRRACGRAERAAPDSLEVPRTHLSKTHEHAPPMSSRTVELPYLTQDQGVTKYLMTLMSDSERVRRSLEYLQIRLRNSVTAA
jgi:Polysaccharide pyruvyl transferase